MLTRAAAQKVAEAHLDADIRARFHHDVVIVEWAVRDRGDAWIFPYNGRGYVERDDWREAMAGNLSIAVDKGTGLATFTE